MPTNPTPCPDLANGIPGRRGFDGLVPVHLVDEPPFNTGDQAQGTRRPSPQSVQIPVKPEGSSERNRQCNLDLLAKSLSLCVK